MSSETVPGWNTFSSSECSRDFADSVLGAKQRATIVSMHDGLIIYGATMVSFLLLLFSNIFFGHGCKAQFIHSNVKVMSLE